MYYYVFAFILISASVSRSRSVWHIPANIIGRCARATTYDWPVRLIILSIQGGLKAAITADTIQGAVLIAVSILICIQGAYETGTVRDVYNINKENGESSNLISDFQISIVWNSHTNTYCCSRRHLGRLEFFKFTGDITTRADTLSAWLGQLFINACVLGCEQNMVQRYLSMSSVSEVRKYVSTCPVSHQYSYFPAHRS